MLLEVFSREAGRLGLIAKGAKRKKSAFGPILQPFLPLLVLWYGRGELLTVRHVEAAGKAIRFEGSRLFSALYVNELTMRLVHRFDPHPDLFELYACTLQRLAADEPVAFVLREYELGLLDALGYGLVLTHDAQTGQEITADALYSYDIETGPVRDNRGAYSLQIHGQTLLDLAVREFDNVRTEQESKRLMRAVLAHYLNGVPLKSREYFYSK